MSTDLPLEFQDLPFWRSACLKGAGTDRGNVDEPQVLLPRPLATLFPIFLSLALGHLP